MRLSGLIVAFMATDTATGFAGRGALALDANVTTAQRSRQFDTLPAAEDGARSTGGEREGGSEGSHTLTSSAMFELITMCRQKHWRMVADHEAMGKGTDRFIVIMGATGEDQEEGDDGGREGEV